MENTNFLRPVGGYEDDRVEVPKPGGYKGGIDVEELHQPISGQGVERQHDRTEDTPQVDEHGLLVNTKECVT